MAKKVKYVRLYLANGETRVIQVKTATANYIEGVIADMIFDSHVMRWELI